MEIKLTKKESEEIFYTSLCNAVGTGYMEGYGLRLTCDRSEYKDCRDHLQRTNPDTEICYEDILMQVLRDGGKLTFVDDECDGEYTSSVSLTDVHERVKNVEPQVLVNFNEEQDDASDADMVLQTVFFGEVIFG
jgi:hypothetical protein